MHIHVYVWYPYRSSWRLCSWSIRIITMHDSLWLCPGLWFWFNYRGFLARTKYTHDSSQAFLPFSFNLKEESTHNECTKVQTDPWCSIRMHVHICLCKSRLKNDIIYMYMNVLHAYLIYNNTTKMFV